MKKTNIYGLGYLEPYINTSTIIDMDELRFRAIENQLYGIYSLFGNGVIDDDPNNPSWHIVLKPTDTTGKIVQITPGKGHVGWKYAETNDYIDVELNPPVGAAYPIKFYIYAHELKTTAVNRNVEFIASTTKINDPNYYVGLGSVTVIKDKEELKILPPQNTFEEGRVDISLFSSLSLLINKHLHIGGTKNPPPINLGSHVQGKLSGEYIEEIDLSKVTKGTLSPDRLPKINHDNLDNVGVLKHSQIDTLITDMYNKHSDNQLSNIMNVNFLQLALALKYQKKDLDQHLLNTILYIPGITDDSFITYYQNYYDYNIKGINAPFVPDNIKLSTVDKTEHKIISVSVNEIKQDQVVWTTYIDFIQAFNYTGEQETVKLKLAYEKDENINNIYPIYSFVCENYPDLNSPVKLKTIGKYLVNDAVVFSNLNIDNIIDINKVYLIYNDLLYTSEYNYYSIIDNHSIPASVVSLNVNLTGNIQKIPLDFYVELSKPFNFISIDTNDMKNNNDSWQRTFIFIGLETLTSQTIDIEYFKDAYEVMSYVFHIYENPIDLSFKNKIAICYSTNIKTEIAFYLILKSGGISKTTYKNNGNNFTQYVLNLSHYMQTIPNNGTYYKVFDLYNFFDNDADKLLINNVIGVGIVYKTVFGKEISNFDWYFSEVNFKLELPTMNHIQDINLYKLILENQSSIFAWNDIKYYKSATLKLLFDSGNDSNIFEQIYINAIVPVGTDLFPVTTKVSNDVSLFNYLNGYNVIGDYKNNWASINPINNKGRFIEISITFDSMVQNLNTPQLKEVYLKYTGVGGLDTPMVWDVLGQWNTALEEPGKIQNIIPQGDQVYYKITNVQCAADNNINLIGTVPLIIDNYEVKNKDKILLFNQTNVIENGIYIVVINNNEYTLYPVTNDNNKLKQYYNIAYITVAKGDVYKGVSFKVNYNINLNILTFEQANTNIVIKDTQNIGRYLYILNNNINEYKYDLNNIIINQVYTNGSNTYLTPRQLYYLQSNYSFISPKDFAILNNGNIVVADTLNDRVIEINKNGEWERAIQGNTLSNTLRNFNLLAAYYNPYKSKMWLTFSQPVNLNITDENLQKISINNTITVIPFNIKNNLYSKQFITINKFEPDSNGKSNTLEVTFPEYINNIIKDWTILNVNIDLSIIINDQLQNVPEEQSEDLYGPIDIIENTSTNNNDLSYYWFNTIPNKIKLVNKNAEIKKSGEIKLNNVIERTPITTKITDIISLPSKIIQVKAIIGNIVFSTIEKPFKIQTDENNNWLITCKGRNSGYLYDYDLNLQWSISQNTINYATIDNYIGNIFKTKNYVIITEPSTQNNSNISIYIQQFDTKTNKISLSLIKRITISEGIAIKTISDVNENYLYVIIKNNLKSKIQKMTYEGKVTAVWPVGLINDLNPIDINLLANGNILVSQ